MLYVVAGQLLGDVDIEQIVTLIASQIHWV
jgi:hypothetical protein